ncbi:cyclic diguanylate phosphodiesterase (EAL) domain-containing protein [Klebsiella pneumoniae]|uniref:EAL domain-containing protein n=1 Tax=Klebsiella pneumoniae TaxID=573 RepID=UPI000E06A8CA|nr:EAL domain-containing protein [Klebsiella pneumoniae]STS09204.1 cyclic diguanylate phosphodiesterase (EAL) domain-containing protein [Klebsiella pneumoniae]HBZ0078073.1 EAL domain-containing protein [Klebsiella pneumoniae]
MRTRHLMALFTGVLILAIILPISLSIWQAARQAKMQFYRELDDYSNRIVVRTLQVADQAREALREADAHTAASCSPEHLLTLRRIAYTHRYIQEVLWLRDSVPQCSSLEDHSVAVTFPPPDHIAPDGYRTWLTSINDLGLDHQMTAMGSRQHMVMIDPVSFIDVVPASEEKIHTMLFGLDHQKMVISSQPLPAKVWQRIKDPHVDMLTLDNTVYRIQRIPELGSGIVTWSSTLPLQQRIRQQLFFWLPAGIFTSLLATWLLLRLLRHLRSPRNSMLDALNSEAIQVHYQPIISLQDGKIAGAEALARWQRPEVHISINLSVDDLRSPTLPTLLHDQLQHWGIAAEQIILEITERGFVDPETTMPVIAHYRQAGHRISIDDFGTGYSSLSYLQKLDVDTLKIDKSFVDTLEYRPLTPHIIEMAKALNLATVAEGVETESQRDWLRQHGVQYAQGWLYSKALPKEQFILWAEHNLHAH